jgi:hypothetical protein
VISYVKTTVLRGLAEMYGSDISKLKEVEMTFLWIIETLTRRDKIQNQGIRQYVEVETLQEKLIMWRVHC